MALRAAQYYVRDLANADRFGKGEPQRVPFLSRVVAQGARIVDRLMNWGANVSIALFLPSWRKLAIALHARPDACEVARGIREDNLIHNPHSTPISSVRRSTSPAAIRRRRG